MITYDILVKKDHLNPDPRMTSAKAQNIDNLRKNLIARFEEIYGMFYGAFTHPLIFEVRKDGKYVGKLYVGNGNPHWSNATSDTFWIVDKATGRLTYKLEVKKMNLKVYKNGRRIYG